MPPHPRRENGPFFGRNETKSFFKRKRKRPKNGWCFSDWLALYKRSKKYSQKKRNIRLMLTKTRNWKRKQKMILLVPIHKLNAPPRKISGPNKGRTKKWKFNERKKRSAFLPPVMPEFVPLNDIV